MAPQTIFSYETNCREHTHEKTFLGAGYIWVIAIEYTPKPEDRLCLSAPDPRKPPMWEFVNHLAVPAEKYPAILQNFRNTEINKQTRFQINLEIQK